MSNGIKEVVEKVQPEAEDTTGTTPAGEDRTFTQEDVNRIVRERLAKERVKFAPVTPAEPSEAEKALAEREKALEARETEITANAFAQKWAVDVDKLKDFSKADLDTLIKGIDALGWQPNPNRAMVGPPPAGSIPPRNSDDHIRQAFGLNKT